MTSFALKETSHGLWLPLKLGLVSDWDPRSVVVTLGQTSLPGPYYTCLRRARSVEGNEGLLKALEEGPRSRGLEAVSSALAVLARGPPL